MHRNVIGAAFNIFIIIVKLTMNADLSSNASYTGIAMGCRLVNTMFYAVYPSVTAIKINHRRASPLYSISGSASASIIYFSYFSSFPSVSGSTE